MIGRRVVPAALSLVGLFLFLWPALRAPVIHWSDSDLDLAQVARGEGIWSPVPDEGRTGHPTKPGYLLFLSTSWRLGGDRGVAVGQAVLLWAGFVLGAWRFGRRLGRGWGIALFLFLIAFLRFRDLGSAILSEALSTALVLPIAVFLLDPPGTKLGIALLGIGEAYLFAVRPNVGAILLALSALAFLLPMKPAALATLLGAFLLVTVPWSLATHSPDDTARAFSYPLAVGASDYGWAISGPTLGSASDAWRATLAEPGPDLRRQLIWRGFHGLMGTEFYDARWSPAYRTIDEAARTAGPFWVLLAVAVLLVSPWRTPERAKELGVALLLLLALQSLVVGALPRYTLPLLPALFAFAFGAAATVPWTPRRASAVAGAFAVLAGLTEWQRQIVDREAGIVEAGGVLLAQSIPRGALALPRPATLHVRIGTPLVPSGVRWTVTGPGGEKLLDSEGASPSDPYLTIPIPDTLAEASRRGRVEILLTSKEGFDPAHYLWFPVIPPPWGSGARRDGGGALSPVTGLERGSLDWWAHPGER